ncbi:MAG: hypothetical protein EAZ16_02660 [Sphingobacteriales bacterium]|nr:MAG: hypothetical protein EAZ16_02660 [Sphingobacteriales bacterium]
MKKTCVLTLAIVLFVIACKKSDSSGNSASGNTATVTFTNNQLFDQRLILTGTADTVFPFSNKVLDIDVKAKTAVTRTDIPAGKRKIYTAIVCVAQQPVNAACTTYIYRNTEYLAGKTYAELLQ